MLRPLRRRNPTKGIGLVAAFHVRSLFGYNAPFPGAPVKPPETLSLQELLPIAVGGRVMYPFTILAGDDFGLDLAPDVLLHCRVNLIRCRSTPSASRRRIRGWRTSATAIRTSFDS